jgi:hypothetical protein
LAYSLVVQAALSAGLAKPYMFYAASMVIPSPLCSWATGLELYSISHRGYTTLVRGTSHQNPQRLTRNNHDQSTRNRVLCYPVIALLLRYGQGPHQQ